MAYRPEGRAYAPEGHAKKIITPLRYWDKPA